jgi:hypothetical protein
MPTDGRESRFRFAPSSRVRLSNTGSLLIAERHRSRAGCRTAPEQACRGVARRRARGCPPQNVTGCHMTSRSGENARRCVSGAAACGRRGTGAYGRPAATTYGPPGPPGSLLCAVQNRPAPRSGDAARGSRERPRSARGAFPRPQQALRGAVRQRRTGACSYEFRDVRAARPCRVRAAAVLPHMKPWTGAIGSGRISRSCHRRSRGGAASVTQRASGRTCSGV